MSLPSVESIVLTHVVEALEECDQAPSQTFRHHGPPPVRCCTDEGILSVHWEPGFPVTSFPQSSENDPVVCSAVPAYPLIVRWLICWPREELAGGSPAIDYVARDTAATRIAIVADCVLRALISLSCAGPSGPLWPHAHNLVRVGRVRPLLPMGGCAGNEWRLVVGILNPDEPT